jgi:hypothetical protein
MFRHVVLFKWADQVDENHVTAVAAGLDDLVAKIDVIRAFRHGRDAGVNDGNYDYAVVADFDSSEDYLRYRDHPAHRAFVAELIAGSVEDRAAIQYDVAD